MSAILLSQIWGGFTTKITAGRAVLSDFDSVEEKQIVNPVDLGASDEDKVRQLNSLTEENRPQVEKFLSLIDGRYGTKSKTSKKEDHKIIEKAHRPRIKETKDWFGVEHIRDSFRFKTVLENIEDLPKIAKDLKESGLCEVVKTDIAKVLQPDIFGWRIAVFDLRMKNGQLVEYYLPVQELEQAKRTGNHATFEKWRDVDRKTMTSGQQLEYRQDIRKSFAKYDRAFDAYLQRTRQKPEQVREALEKTKRIFDKSKDKEVEKPSQEKKPSKLIERIRQRKEKNKEDDLMR